MGPLSLGSLLPKTPWDYVLRKCLLPTGAWSRTSRVKKSTKKGEYVWKETERAEFSQYASEHGVAKAVCYYEKKLEGKVPETTVH